MPPYVSLQTMTGDKISVHGKASITQRTSEDFGRTRLTQHLIDMEQHPRRLPFAKQEVQKLIKMMSLSHHPWSKRKMDQPDFAQTVVG
ncbi:hypothetical protein TNCV_41611 [Trichonephila clavipes]|nr:hypothetical protein TNCV_41611 [Trichonephila clavipes]